MGKYALPTKDPSPDGGRRRYGAVDLGASLRQPERPRSRSSRRRADHRAGFRLAVDAPEPVPATAQQLLDLNAQLLVRPDGFQGDPKLERRVLQPRANSISEPAGISWGHAEALAFAVILSEGTSIRLTGQDCERGTFGHRNAVLHDMETGRTYTPLQSISASRASFSVFNSPLSENAALGFEYGYNINAPKTLTLWEAQFGDFANGAQVIVDQFLASGLAKWQEASSVVMLLPHGYEGQGPEHSSARLERYLQLAAGDNICVANCTTAAQFFHLLRRQVASLASEPRPLIVMTPKSLLRHNRAASSLIDLTHGEFQTVIDDQDAVKRAGKVTRLILCSGKIYMDMAYSNTSPYAPRPEFAAADQVALVRVEQLYPFPEEMLQQVVAGYPNLREIVWMQEEPKNMGAWTFVETSPAHNEPARIVVRSGMAQYSMLEDRRLPALPRVLWCSTLRNSLVFLRRRWIIRQSCMLTCRLATGLRPEIEIESWGLGAQNRDRGG